MAKKPRLVELDVSELTALAETDGLSPSVFGLDLKLTPRQIDYCHVRENPGSPTYGNSLRSCIAAGFPEAGAAGTSNRLDGHAGVQKYCGALRSFWAKVYKSDADSIQCDLGELQTRCRARDDLSTLYRTIELKCKLSGLLDKGMATDDGEERRLSNYDAAGQERLRRIAAAIIAEEQAEKQAGARSA